MWGKHMKKATCMFAILVLAICLAGCMRFDTSITIKSNGKMDVKMLYAAMDMSDYSGGESTSSGLTPEQKQQYEAEGWKVEDYTSDGYTGFVISQNDVDLRGINAAMKQTSENTKQGGDFGITRSGFKYTLKWQVYGSSDKTSMSQAAPYINQSGGYMKFRINLPVKPISSNATSTSNNGKSLEWDLLNLGDDGTIEVTYTLINVPLIIILSVVALVLIAAVVVVIIVIKKKGSAKQF